MLLLIFLLIFFSFLLPGPNQSPRCLCLHTECSRHLRSYPSLPNTPPCGSTPLPTRIPIKWQLNPSWSTSTMNGNVLDYSDGASNVRHQDFGNFILFYFGLYLEFSVSQLLFFFFSLPQVTFDTTVPPLSYLRLSLDARGWASLQGWAHVAVLVAVPGFLRLRVGFHVHTDIA